MTAIRLFGPGYTIEANSDSYSPIRDTIVISANSVRDTIAANSESYSPIRDTIMILTNCDSCSPIRDTIAANSDSYDRD